MARNFVTASSQYLEYAGAVLSALPITMAAWVRPDSSGLYRAVCSLYTSGANAPGFDLFIDYANVPYCESRTVPATVIAYAASAATTGVWSHAAAVFASTTSRTCYRNGVAGTANTTSNAPSGWGRAAIGRMTNNGGNAFYFGGDVAEVAFWNVALTTADIAQLAAGFSPLFVQPNALVAYWPLIGRNDPEMDVIAGQGMTNTSSTVAVHPRILRPRPTRGQFWGAAAVTTGAYRLAGRPLALVGPGGLVG